MGIDYIINYGCVPKEMLTTEGLLERLKAGEQAQALMNFYRNNGDMRPVEEMGGEVLRRAADGEHETRTIMVADLIKMHHELDPLEHHCVGCPANAMQRRFGCIGHLNYPISQQAEQWMLEQLPHPDYDPLPFLLLTKAEEFGCTGETGRWLRDQVGVIFESGDTLARRYPEMDISTDQLFEMFFLIEPTIPVKRSIMILMFMGAIERNMDAHELMNLTPAASDAAERLPFRLHIEETDDHSTADIKRFLYALYRAYLLDRDVLLDV